MSEVTIKAADVMLFEAGDSWVGKCIAWLTNSTVSHAALYESEGKLIEMRSSGIQETKFEVEDDGTKVYIMRLSPEKEPSPVLSEAQKYLNAKIRYDFPELVILAGLLIYRTIRPTQKFQKLTDLIINAACSVLDKLLQKATHTEGAMICSQLVYQCYLNCGEEYRIRLSFDSETSEDAVCLKDLLEKRGDVKSDALLTDRASEEYDPEALAKELYEAMTGRVEEDTITATAVSDSLLATVKKFLALIEKILEQTGEAIPVQSLFVTPGDLLDRATNLSRIGTVNVKRE